MNDPWQVLGLSRDTATEKEVKSAYARLIKQHRPDTDPEGFQRVRQAYEAALAMVKNKSAPYTGPIFNPPAAEPMAPSGDDPALPASTPPDLIEAELAVHRAREAVDTEALAKALASLCPICRSLRPGRAGFQMWRDALHRVTEGRSALVAMGVPLSQMIDELESGSAAVTHEVAGYWEGMHDTDHLLTLAEAVMAQARRLHNEDSAIMALQLGLEIGFIRPALATALATFAFPHIDRQAREQLIPQVEQQAAIGNLMCGLNKEQMAFWHARVRNPRHNWDWNDAASQAALDYLARETVPLWSGFNIIRQVAPATWFSRLEKEMGRRQGGLMGKFRPSTLGRPRAQPQRASRSGTKRFGWVAFLLLMVVVRIMPECRNYTPVDPSRPRYVGYPKLSDTSLQRVPSLSSPRLTTDPLFSRPGVVPKWPPVPAVKPVDTEAAMSRFAKMIGADETLPAVSLATPPPSRISIPADSSTAAGKARADKLLQQDRSLHYWIEGSNEIGATALSKLNEVSDPKQKQEVWKKYCAQIHDLMDKLHKTTHDPAHEQHFLEFLMCSPDTTYMERQVALARMSEVVPVDILLPLWEGALNLGSQVSQQVCRAASIYLKVKGPELTSDERERMEAMAKRNL